MIRWMFVVLPLLAVSARADEPPIVLKDMGSFHVGGRLVTLSGKPVHDVLLTPGGVPTHVDPNGTYQVEQMYVQYFIPQTQRGAVPLLLWHGGGLTGVTWETTPDGREGWETWFVRQGWPVYVSDAVERGRAGFAGPDIFKGDPLFLTTANPFERFRIGAGAGSYNADPALRKFMPNSQFPAEGYDAFTKQVVPRWTTTDDAILAAYIAEIDRVCPCVILFHSQGGQFGFRAAQARPDKVRALVAVEPAAIGDPAQAAALKSIPILFVYGDNIPLDARWPTMHQTGIAWAEQLRAAGADVEVIELPEHGIHGNSHMMMMDRNNLQVGGVIQDWLAAKGIWK
jgi:pimeloyl-ACP methyl ester carboxylesterase